MNESLCPSKVQLIDVRREYLISPRWLGRQKETLDEARRLGGLERWMDAGQWPRMRQLRTQSLIFNNKLICWHKHVGLKVQTSTAQGNKH